MISTNYKPVNMVDLRKIYYNIIQSEKRNNRFLGHVGFSTVSQKDRITNSINIVKDVYFSNIENIRKYNLNLSASFLWSLIKICMLNDDPKTLDELIKNIYTYKQINDGVITDDLYKHAINMKGKVPCIKVIKWLLDRFPLIKFLISDTITKIIRSDKYEIFDIMFEYIMKNYDRDDPDLIVSVCGNCISNRNPYFINKFSNHNLMTVDWMLEILSRYLEFNYFKQYKQILLSSKFDSIFLTNLFISGIKQPSSFNDKLICMKLIKDIYWEKVGRYLHLWDILKYPDITKHISNIFFFDYMMYIRFISKSVVKRKLPICYDIDSSDELVLFY